MPISHIKMPLPIENSSGGCCQNNGLRWNFVPLGQLRLGLDPSRFATRKTWPVSVPVSSGPRRSRTTEIVEAILHYWDLCGDGRTVLSVEDAGASDCSRSSLLENFYGKDARVVRTASRRRRAQWDLPVPPLGLRARANEKLAAVYFDPDEPVELLSTRNFCRGSCLLLYAVLLAPAS